MDATRGDWWHALPPRPIRRGPRLPRRLHARPSRRRHARRGAPRPRALGGRDRRRVRVLGGRRARPRARRDAARRRPRAASPPGRRSRCSPALAAASAPAGAEVLCVDGDFSSVVGPFLARGDLRVRHVPLDRLADAIGPDTWLVVVLARAVRDGRGRRCGIRRRGRDRPPTHACWSTRRRRPAGCRPTGTRCRPHRLPRLQVAVRPARSGVRRVLTPCDRRDHAATRRAGTRAPTRGHRATAPTCTSPRTPAGSTSPPPGTPGSAPRPRSGSPRRSTRTRCATTRSASRTRSASGSAWRPRDSAIVTWPDADGTELAALTARGHHRLGPRRARAGRVPPLERRRGRRPRRDDARSLSERMPRQPA